MYKTCLANCKTNRFPHPPTRILKLYIGSLMGFSHVSISPSLNNLLLSQVYILEKGSHCGNNRQSVLSKDGGRNKGPPVAQVVLRGQPRSHPLNFLFQ